MCVGVELVLVWYCMIGWYGTVRHGSGVSRSRCCTWAVRRISSRTRVLGGVLGCFLAAACGRRGCCRTGSEAGAFCGAGTGPRALLDEAPRPPYLPACCCCSIRRLVSGCAIVVCTERLDYVFGGLQKSLARPFAESALDAAAAHCFRECASRVVRARFYGSRRFCACFLETGACETFRWTFLSSLSGGLFWC